MGSRQSIPKSVRFEVFKRDCFKCQYCGATAPEVLLHVDHITPVASGGTNELLNLVTSCAACNSGKSDRLLGDDSAVQKARAQLEELQERREQLEMMLAWRQGLRDLAQDTVQAVCEYWHGLSPGWSVNDNGKAKVKKWLLKFTVDEILHAMDVAATQYLERNAEGQITSESWEEAWSKIPRICTVERESKNDPDVRELYLIRGILRNRLRYVRESDCMDLLKAARSWEVPVEDLRRTACWVTSWSRFETEVLDMIESQRAILEPAAPQNRS